MRGGEESNFPSLNNAVNPWERIVVSETINQVPLSLWLVPLAGCTLLKYLNTGLC